MIVFRLTEVKIYESGAMDERPVNPARAGMQQRQPALSCRSPLTPFSSLLASVVGKIR